MLIQNFSARLTVRTTAAVEQALKNWLLKLQSMPAFAFGDDPTPVFELEDVLQEASARFEHLQRSLDQEDTPFQTLLAYRTTRERIRRIYEFVLDVRDQEQGSTALTRTLTRMLTECLYYLRQFRTEFDDAIAINRQVSIGD